MKKEERKARFDDERKVYVGIEDFIGRIKTPEDDKRPPALDTFEQRLAFYRRPRLYSPADVKLRRCRFVEYDFDDFNNKQRNDGKASEKNIRRD